jgi:hypothetical protein
LYYWHPLSKILDFNLLLWNHLANWNRTTNFRYLLLFPRYSWLVIWDTKNNENVILSFDHRLDKGVLIADIYICTTVYINLKNLSQWFQRGLIVKVYRGQQTPSCSNTSHDHYNLHRSCVPDLCHTTRWLFSGGG